MLILIVSLMKISGSNSYCFATDSAVFRMSFTSTHQSNTTLSSLACYYTVPYRIYKLFSVQYLFYYHVQMNDSVRTKAIERMHAMERASVVVCLKNVKTYRRLDYLTEVR